MLCCVRTSSWTLCVDFLLSVLFLFFFHLKMKPTVKSLSGQNCCFSQYVLHLPYLFLSSPFQFLSPLAYFSVVLKRKKKKRSPRRPFYTAAVFKRVDGNGKSAVKRGGGSAIIKQLIPRRNPCNYCMLWTNACSVKPEAALCHVGGTGEQVLRQTEALCLRSSLQNKQIGAARDCEAFLG